MDLRMASLSQKSIDYLTQCMPRTTVDGVEEEVYDYQAYLEDVSLKTLVLVTLNTSFLGEV